MKKEEEHNEKWWIFTFPQWCSQFAHNLMVRNMSGTCLVLKIGSPSLYPLCTNNFFMSTLLYSSMVKCLINLSPNLVALVQSPTQHSSFNYRVITRSGFHNLWCLSIISCCSWVCKLQFLLFVQVYFLFKCINSVYLIFKLYISLNYICK